MPPKIVDFFSSFLSHPAFSRAHRCPPVRQLKARISGANTLSDAIRSFSPPGIKTLLSWPFALRYAAMDMVPIYSCQISCMKAMRDIDVTPRFKMKISKCKLQIYSLPFPSWSLGTRDFALSHGVNYLKNPSANLKPFM